MSILDLGVGLGLASWVFIAPAAAWWFFVLRSRVEGCIEGVVAAAAFGSFFTPGIIYVLNQIFGYPLTLASATAIATVLVVAAPAWARFVQPRVNQLEEKILAAVKRVVSRP